MKPYTDLSPGLYRGTWVNGVRRGLTVLHKFNVIGEGVVVVPAHVIDTPNGAVLETDCNAQLSLDFGPVVERECRSPGLAGMAFLVRRVTVQEVPA